MNEGHSPIQPLVVFALAVASILATGLLLDRDHFAFALSRGTFSSGEEAEIRQTVKHFNGLIVDISASRGRTSSDDLPATKAMRHKLYMDTGAYTMAKQVLVYDLASLEIVSVSWQNPTTAVVMTREDWNYQYRNAQDKAELDVVKGMSDEFRYVLLKRKGTWLVHASSALLKEHKRGQ